MTYLLIGIYVLGFGFVFRNRYKAYLTAAHERSYRLYKTIEHGSVKEAMSEKTALAIFMGFSWPATFWLPLLKGTIKTDVEKRLAVEKKEAELKELQRKIDADMKKLGLPAVETEPKSTLSPEETEYQNGLRRYTDVRDIMGPHYSYSTYRKYVDHSDIRQFLGISGPWPEKDKG